MVFTSISFLFVFLPLALFLYFLTPRNINARNNILLLLSLIFYAFGDLNFTAHLIALTSINYFVSRYLDRTAYRKRIFIATLTLNLSILAFYKYIPAVLNLFSGKSSSIYLPLGISFFTFQNISYLADVYNRKVSPPRSLRDYLLYIMFFPQLIAGPIVKYTDIKHSLTCRHTDINIVYSGFERLSCGLLKKAVLAENLAKLSDTMFSQNPGNLPLPYAWLGAIAYMLQIYYDFSGYSDIAIGLGLMFGFKYSENFNHPYLSNSISDFFRRWHITLTSFFREYVYIPLGGNRRGKPRTIINTLIVFGLTGLWHGASLNYILWGLYNGVLISLEKVTSTHIKRLPRRILNLIFILAGWVLFRSPSVHEAFLYYKAMTVNPLTLNYGTFFYRFINFKYLSIIFISILFAGPHLTVKKLIAKYNALSFVYKLIPPILFILSAIKIIISTYKPFIYFRF